MKFCDIFQARVSESADAGLDKKEARQQETLRLRITSRGNSIGFMNGSRDTKRTNDELRIAKLKEHNEEFQACRVTFDVFTYTKSYATLAAVVENTNTKEAVATSFAARLTAAYSRGSARRSLSVSSSFAVPLCAAKPETN